MPGSASEEIHKSDFEQTSGVLRAIITDGSYSAPVAYTGYLTGFVFRKADGNLAPRSVLLRVPLWCLLLQWRCLRIHNL